LVKGLAVEVKAGLIFLGEFFFKDVLGFDTSMVGAWEPEGGFALHAGKASEDVFEGDEHGVPDVEGIVGVGWGHDDAEGFTIGIYLGLEGIGLLPKVVDFGFVDGVVVTGIH